MFHEFICAIEKFSCHGLIKDGKLETLTFSLPSFQKAKKWLLNQYPDAEFVTTERSKIQNEIAEYLNGKRKSFSVQLGTIFLDKSTEFQQKVLDLISAIPYGETRTYGDLAKGLGDVNYSRAVGGACHTNPIGLVIPCHRVVGSKDLGGFAGGIELKKLLLQIEKTRLTN